MTAKSAPALLGFLLIAAAPAGADWLVTRAGGRVETQGAWQVKGKLVVFALADGSLSSLRLADVDLEASQQVSEAAKARAEEPETPEPVAAKKKLAILTDKDFKPAPGSGTSAAAAAAPKSGEPPAGSPPAPGPVTVSSWQKIDLPNGAGLAIEGTLHNTTKDLIVNAFLEVQLFNDGGERTATSPAILKTVSIQPDGTTGFRATFPGIFIFTEVKFDARGLPLTVSPAPESKPENP